MTSKRFQDWAVRLDAYIQSKALTPFTWGEHDCCLMAAGAVEAMTGIDVATKWRKAYGNPEAALHLVHVISGRGVRELIREIADEHGFNQINPKFAQRGDVVMFNTNGEGVGMTLGVCLGDKIAIPGKDKMYTIPMHSVWDNASTKAWKIG